MSETNQSAIEFPGDSRIHIGLAVSNLEESKRELLSKVVFRRLIQAAV